MTDVQVGKEYTVHHTRKGYFRVRIDEVDGSFVQATITAGKARYLTESDRGPGDHIMLDLERPFITLSPIETQRLSK